MSEKPESDEKIMGSKGSKEEKTKRMELNSIHSKSRNHEDSGSKQKDIQSEPKKDKNELKRKRIEIDQKSRIKSFNI